jgi:hypothetical protein
MISAYTEDVRDPLFYGSHETPGKSNETRTMASTQSSEDKKDREATDLASYERVS